MRRMTRRLRKLLGRVTAEEGAMVKRWYAEGKSEAEIFDFFGRHLATENGAMVKRWYAEGKSPEEVVALFRQHVEEHALKIVGGSDGFRELLQRRRASYVERQTPEVRRRISTKMRVIAQTKPRSPRGRFATRTIALPFYRGVFREGPSCGSEGEKMA